MSADAPRLIAKVEFCYLAKYEGERGPRKPSTGNEHKDNLQAMQEDLADPACFEICAFGDAFPLQIWRKVHGPD